MCVTCWVDEGHIWGCSPNLPCKIDIRCIQSSRVLCDLLPDGVRAGLREDLKVKLAEDEYDRHRKCAGQFHAVLPTRLSHALRGAGGGRKAKVRRSGAFDFRGPQAVEDAPFAP